MALRRNEQLVGAHFAIGVEDALFLRGELPLSRVSEAELDRVVGSIYAYVEQCFRGLFAPRASPVELRLTVDPVSRVVPASHGVDHVG